MFTPSILPKYLRKTKSIEELIPWLYLNGISTNDFPEALQSLLGMDAKGLSASTVTRLKAVWEEEYAEWSKRPLAGKRHVYLWADCIHSNVRFNDNEGHIDDEKRQYLLVLNGEPQRTAPRSLSLLSMVIVKVNCHGDSWLLHMDTGRASGTLTSGSKSPSPHKAKPVWHWLRQFHPAEARTRVLVATSYEVLSGKKDRLCGASSRSALPGPVG